MSADLKTSKKEYKEGTKSSERKEGKKHWVVVYLDEWVNIIIIIPLSTHGCWLVEYWLLLSNYVVILLLMMSRKISLIHFY